MGISIVLLAQDFSALTVALPAIERDLDTDLSTVQWVINVYALVFAILIVTGGRLADQFGRRVFRRGLCCRRTPGPERTTPSRGREPARQRPDRHGSNARRSCDDQKVMA